MRGHRGHIGGDWVCTLAHARGSQPRLVHTPAARSGVLVGAAQKGPKASSYTTTAAINQCCRRTVKQYDVASIIDGNPSSAFRDFSRPTVPTSGSPVPRFSLNPRRNSCPPRTCKFHTPPRLADGAGFLPRRSFSLHEKNAAALAGKTTIFLIVIGRFDLGR